MTGGKVSCPSYKNLLNIKKNISLSTGYIPIHYIPIMGSYMVDVYEVGIYGWSLMSLRYLLIPSLTALR